MASLWSFEHNIRMCFLKILILDWDYFLMFQMGEWTCKQWCWILSTSLLLFLVISLLIPKSYGLSLTSLKRFYLDLFGPIWNKNLWWLKLFQNVPLLKKPIVINLLIFVEFWALLKAVRIYCYYSSQYYYIVNLLLLIK